MVGAATVQQQYFDAPEDSSEDSPRATVRQEERIVAPGKTRPRFVYPWPRQEGATSLGWFIYAEEYADSGSCVLRISEFDEMQRRKNEAVIRLLDEWLADESGYDEETWPELKKGIETARPSYRRRFRD